MTQFASLLVIIPLIMSFFILLFGSLKRGLPFVLSLFSLLGCNLVSLILLLKIVLFKEEIRYFFGGWEPPFGIEYVVDFLNAPILFLIALSSLFILIHFKDLFHKELEEKKMREFFTLFLLEITGLFGITVTGDLFNLYVLLEVASFSAYVLCAKGSEDAPFFAFRYMIFGTVGACMYLLGVGYIYILTGSLNILDLKNILPNLYGSKSLLVGFSFLVSGIALKMALFPLHIWLPDAYTNAPKFVATLLASLSTKVLCYVFIRIIFFLFEPSFFLYYPSLLTIFGYIASSAMIFSGIMAIIQKDLIRMCTYILISEIGYIVLGLSMANRFGLLGSLFHIINDILMMALIFSFSGTISLRAKITLINNLKGLQKRLPFAFSIFFMLSLSLIGVPPFCGFFSKWFLILGTIQDKSWILLSSIFLSTMLNAIAVLRIVDYAFFWKKDDDEYEKMSKGEYISLSFFTFLIIFVGIESSFIVEKVLMPFAVRCFGE